LAKKAATRRSTKPEQQSLFGASPQKGKKTEKAPKSKAAHLHRSGKAKPAPAEAKKVREAKAVELEAELPIVIPDAPKPRQRVTAEKMGTMQREISISEFFTKNRHLLGFDNASRALLTSVKEAVDNSLDACEEAGIQPVIIVRVAQINESRYRMMVEDNGPGIVKAQIPKVFGKLLYGSKFHRLRQSRGQQGIGISAAGMYGQLTTGKPVVVISKTGPGKPAHNYHLTIDTTQNKPVITHEAEVEWSHKDHGTSVEIEMEASYKGGRKSLDEFMQMVAVANPHARLEYFAPGKQPVIYPRLTEEMPRETKEIKPHPYGVELGILQRMIQGTKSRTIGGFLSAEFSRVSAPVAAEICKNAGIDPDTATKDLEPHDPEKVYQAIAKTKIMAPPTNCLAPIGEPALLEGLKALLVQRHFAEEEAAARRKAEEGGQIAEDKAAEAAEHKITEALKAITTVELPAEDEEEKDEVVVDEDKPKKIEKKRGAAKKVAGKGEEAPIEVKTLEEPEVPPTEADILSRGGVISVFDKPVFVTAVTRGPRVYRGNPFQVEAALAYGGDLAAEELATVCRFANRVPLLYQQGACAMSQAVMRTNWRGYDVEQARGALPTGPLLVVVHIASVWVPFTSEAKEAVAHYDEIINELRFALQECGRRLSRHIRRRRRASDEEKKARYIERYIPHIGLALQEILKLTDAKRDKAVDELTGILERSRKM
jgi:DNA topoisomerase VI subunit B